MLPSIHRDLCVMQTIYRVRDPATGLYWNNDYYSHPRFVDQRRAHTWATQKAAEDRAQRYLRRQTEGVKELAHCPKTIEVVAFTVVEQESAVVPQVLSDGQRLLANVRTRLGRGGECGLVELLIKRPTHARYRYLVQFVWSASKQWRLSDRIGAEVDRIVALLPKRKAVLRLDTDGIALREASELFVVKSAIPHEIEIEVLDLDEYRD